MPNPRRRERLSSLIEQIISELIRQMKDPRVAGLVSVHRVEVAPDARLARIFVSVLGSEDDRRSTIRGLEHATGFLRSRLGDELTIRHVPELQFVLDRSIEEGDRVIALMNTIEIPPAPAGGEDGDVDWGDDDDADDDEDGEDDVKPKPPGGRSRGR